MKKLISAAEAAGMVKDGMTVMIGGFLGNGSPHAIIDALVESGVKDLTLIVNDTITLRTCFPAISRPQPLSG